MIDLLDRYATLCPTRCRKLATEHFPHHHAFDLYVGGRTYRVVGDDRDRPQLKANYQALVIKAVEEDIRLRLMAEEPDYRVPFAIDYHRTEQGLVLWVGLKLDGIEASATGKDLAEVMLRALINAIELQATDNRLPELVLG